MAEAVILPMPNGIQIAVPNTLELITPYVLREQLDFFEDELQFIRGLLRAGQHVIDVGANFGVYTLSMAQKVGSEGHVWSFEPASSTASFLAQGIAANSFAHVTLEQKAVSSSSGRGQLALKPNPELNAIVHSHAIGECEEVALVTLDECMDQYGWTDIELIKIDAEGEENNILKGGLRFFEKLTPLVQYEVRRDATNINFGLIREFASLGYSSYRLVPGLNLLVPFDDVDEPDPYLLNLFCCKVERADRLAAEGLLLRASDIIATRGFTGARRDSRWHDAKYHWSHALARLPYAAVLSADWKAAEEASDASAAVLRALSLHSLSRDVSLPALERFIALEASFLTLASECERESVRLRLASLARVAHDYGARAATVTSLKRLLEYIRVAGINMKEPFLPPLERFDLIPIEDTVSWLVASVLEQLEKREYYSTFYAGAASLERLTDIDALGLGSPEMKRRLDLVRMRIDDAHRQTKL
jgi:FkbM family methyltransferase